MVHSSAKRFLLALLVGVLPVVAGAQATPTLSFTPGASGPEGDFDGRPIRLAWNLSHAVGNQTRFVYQTRAPSSGPAATPGIDYEAHPPTEMIIPPFMTTGDITVYTEGDRMVEADELIEVVVLEMDGLAAAGAAQSLSAAMVIENDDSEAVPPLVGNPDFAWFELNGPGVGVAAADNDISDASFLYNATIAVTDPPRHGQVEVLEGYGGGPLPFHYQPETDFAGRDEFGYRLCLPEGPCVESRVVLQGRLEKEQVGNGRVGRLTLPLRNLPVLAAGRWEASALAEARMVTLPTTADATPDLVWDSRAGLGWTMATLPAAAGGVPDDFVVHAEAMAAAEGSRLMIGVDLDRDGEPSQDEILCQRNFNSTERMECDARLMVEGAPVAYWVAMHSRDATPQGFPLRVSATRLRPDGRLVATGPVTLGGDDTAVVVVNWEMPESTLDDYIDGYVRLYEGDIAVGEFRLRFRGGGGEMFLPANDGLVFEMLGGETERQLVLDVPEGASRLAVEVQSQQTLEVQLKRLGGIDARKPGVELYPADDGRWTAVPAGVSRTLSVENPGYGRWYLFVRNLGARTRVQVANQTRALAPQIRPGSYFNPARPGNGLILYPAGNQWAGLWYTHFGGPTWYYLQAPMPGNDGIWRSPVYRALWDGSSARNVRVGELQLVATGQDGFIMSYTLDGAFGGQPMAALGRGCPGLKGQVVDASSHWFDPVRSGTGYSVQTWPHYEFYAAFLYDPKGWPVFLAAEGPFADQEQADLYLELISGNSPTSEYIGPLRREPAGVLRRVIREGRLDSIELDADYPLPGNNPLDPPERHVWSVVDRLQLLGGPGTTQGCAP